MHRSILIITVALFLTACSNPASDKSRAVTTDAAPVSSAPVQGEKFSITPQNSRIEFVGSKVTGSHQGSFEKFSGAIDYNGKPETSKVTINIDMPSVKTDADGLTQHLKTPDFFDVTKYPEAKFESTGIKAGGDKGASHTVTGNLTLHGITKSISFPATISATPSAITVDSTFALNRKDFGINYAGGADNLIRDEVVLTLKVSATK